MKQIRIKTSPILDSDKYVQINLEQNFDILEVLSLNISQTDAYTLHDSDYGVVAGRCYMNNGLGIPNVKVSIFIPIDEVDSLSPTLLSMYPYSKVSSTNGENKRYNLLPNTNKDECHVAVGSFPTKNEILDNEGVGEIYNKYYKFTTVTNSSGDYMFFGLPVGQYTLVADCDLSDIGQFSQKPYDLIEEGASPNSFQSTNQFNESNNLNSLVQIKNKIAGVYVYPFWGSSDTETIGISRLDFDLEYTIKPKALFIGSILSDNEKDSVNKNCVPRKNLGRLCDTSEKSGTMEMIRVKYDGGVERLNINGGDLINDDGVWAFRIPMNLDYMITDESGNMIPSEDPTKGIATRSSVRFRVNLSDTGNGRLRTTAKFLIPHNPNSNDEIDYEFSENTKGTSFGNMYWNKIYTVKSFIPRLQVGCESGRRCIRKRTMIAIKDVDDCSGTKNPFPFNKFNGRMNPLFTVLCLIMGAVIDVLTGINQVFSWLYGIKIGPWRPFRKLRCISINCEDLAYVPGCSGKATPNGYSDAQRYNSATKECFRSVLAEFIKIYTFDFYNDWINGTLYAPLLKYKERANGDKLCNADESNSMVHVNTLYKKSDNSYVTLDHNLSIPINRGFVKKYDDGIYYTPYTQMSEKLFATDFYNLGAMNEYDWQGMPMIHEQLEATTFQISQSLAIDDTSTTPVGRGKKAAPISDGSNKGLLFEYDCDDFDMSYGQIDNLSRLTEIGVGLDETRNYLTSPNDKADGFIKNNDIENKYIRDVMIYLNSSEHLDPNVPISSNFDGIDYAKYKGGLTKIGAPSKNSLYFYFGSKPGKSAINKIRNEFFAECFPKNMDVLNVTAEITNIDNGNDGKIIVSVIGGVGPYTFEWSDGATGNTRTNLSAGSYKVLVTDNVGNSKTKIFTVKAPSEILFSYLPSDINNTQSSDGKVEISNISGGRQILVNGTYQYVYKVEISGAVSRTVENVTSFGTTISNLPKGNYSIVIKDYATNQTVSSPKNFFLNDPLPLGFSLTPVEIPCLLSNAEINNGESDGGFNIDQINGNGGYSWKVEFNPTSSSGTFTNYYTTADYDKHKEVFYNNEKIGPINNGGVYVTDDIEMFIFRPGYYKITLYDSVSKALQTTTNSRKDGVTKSYQIKNVATVRTTTRNGNVFTYTPEEMNDENVASSSFIVQYYVTMNTIDEQGNPSTYNELIKEVYTCDVSGSNISATIPTSSLLTGRVVYFIDHDGCPTSKITV